MRSIILAGVVLIATSFIVPTSHANEQLLISVCSYVKDNDKSRLRKKLKEGRITLRNIYADLKCNSNNLLQTAYSSSADEVGEYIVKRVSSKALTQSKVWDWANANGHADSPITAALKSKLKL
ncbi:DUF3718 domain-containing protein [Parashewanella spongiae]|uniref:DUF3718 domain-containing protein n=1 Tax=Parashewanella spongiae TaxID=342950 RepID=A0A3A6U974_9GAMM|nr:DUF3718 domain-containing protein [Parashewanella spongiae]MCL1076683.1 DUF3718 domain-containing protein [Parashewanella spongiae]RJY18491.1 DUF3718 domain-containing protein [Parashewanella spongiae]